MESPNTVTVDLSLDRGRLKLDAAFQFDSVVVVTGSSGAGKTTLLRVLAGLDHCDDGHLSVGESVWVSAGASLPAELRSVGYLSQEGGLFPHMSAVDNVAFPLIGDRIGRRLRRANATALLDQLGLAEVVDAAVIRLSGGQRRRVALARALAADRSLYLLDEPFAGLDSRSADLTLNFLGNRLSRLAAPALIAGHDLLRLSLLSDRTLRLTGGRIVEPAADPVLTERGSEGRAHVQARATTRRSTVHTLADYRVGSR
ncbi:MAG: ATP-binding cassette domain-containing protein [Solirubrobacterales bacterium]